MNVNELIKQLNKIKKKTPDAEVFVMGDEVVLPLTGRIALAFTDDHKNLLALEEEKVSKSETEELKVPFVILET